MNSHLNVDSSSRSSQGEEYKEFDCEKQHLMPERIPSLTQGQELDELHNEGVNRDSVVSVCFWFVILVCGGAILGVLLYLDTLK